MHAQIGTVGKRTYLDAVDDRVVPRGIVLLVGVDGADLGTRHQLVNYPKVGLLALLHFLIKKERSDKEKKKKKEKIKKMSKQKKTSSRVPGVDNENIVWLVFIAPLAKPMVTKSAKHTSDGGQQQRPSGSADGPNPVMWRQWLAGWLVWPAAETSA